MVASQDCRLRPCRIHPGLGASGANPKGQVQASPVCAFPFIVVMLDPIAPVADVDTVATLMLLALAVGVGWFLWRRT
jgi:hypothetical protein